MSLQHYQKMNVGWGFSGIGYNGIPSGAIINNVDQQVGTGCGEFDGNDEVNFSSFYDPSGTTKLSIEAWFKNTAWNKNDTIFSWFPTGNIRIQTDFSGTEGLFLAFRNSTARYAVDTHTAFVYFALVYDGTLSGDANRLKLNINGTFVTLTFVAGGVPASIETVTDLPKIGNAQALARYWAGLIDDLAIYDHALTQDEIDYRYNGGAGREIQFVSPMNKFYRGLNRGLGRGL